MSLAIQGLNSEEAGRLPGNGKARHKGRSGTGGRAERSAYKQQ